MIRVGESVKDSQNTKNFKLNQALFNVIKKYYQFFIDFSIFQQVFYLID